MSVRAMRAALATFLATALLAAGAGAAAFVMVYRYPDRPRAAPSATVRFVVPRGANLSQVARELADAGLVESPTLFRLYATWRGLAHRIRAGEHDLRGDASPRQILDRLVAGGGAPERAVTIPEGKTLLEAAARLEGAGLGPADGFAALARDPGFARALGVPADSLEGYLFPDTYRLRADAPARDVLAALVRRFRAVLGEVKAAHPGAADQLRATLGWSDHEIVVMASIVEKETGAAHERPMVAAVYLNRLTRPSFSPKLLEADPTIIYGCTVPLKKSAACARFSDRIRTAQLRDRDNPYNTYVHAGLPPGPIASPGRAALAAVLAPARTDHLFFVSKNDGTHHFSATLAEHRAAVDRYQRGRP